MIFLFFRGIAFFWLIGFILIQLLSVLGCGRSLLLLLLFCYFYFLLTDWIQFLFTSKLERNHSCFMIIILILLNWFYLLQDGPHNFLLRSFNILVFWFGSGFSFNVQRDLCYSFRILSFIIDFGFRLSNYLLLLESRSLLRKLGPWTRFSSFLKIWDP